MPRSALAAACAAAVTVAALSGCSHPSQGSASASPSATSDASGEARPANGLPSQSRWLADVRTAMSGSQAFLDQRVRQAHGEAGTRLAVSLDIDNTALASEYDFGAAVPDVLAFARHASDRGVAVMFDTARAAGGDAQQKTEQQLRSAGYPVTEVCMRTAGEDVVAGKQRCRRHFHDEGFTLIANVGNNDTDFEGGDYERAFRLPNYGTLS